LDIGSALLSAASTRRRGLTQTIRFGDRKGGKKAQNGGCNDFGVGMFHGYWTEVNLMGPSFGIGTPPLSRL
jgi:hypothetical protein